MNAAQPAPADGPPPTGTVPTRIQAVRASFLERYTGVLVLVVMFAIFSILLPGKFLTFQNITGVIGGLAISGMMALAVLIPLATGVFDISIAGVMTVSIIGVTWLFMITDGQFPIPLAILIVLLFGVGVGLFNAFLVVKGRVDPFIGTIGTGTVLVGVSVAIANGATISNGIPGDFTALSRTTIFGSIPLTVVYFAIAVAVMWYILDLTPFGRRVYATGAGRDAARLAGVRTNRILTIAFMVSALMAAIAGVVYAGSLGAGPPNLGASYLLPAYASAFLGSTMIRPGRFNVPGLVIALFIVGFGINGLQLAGVPFWITDIYQGGVLIVAVLIAKLRSR